MGTKPSTHWPVTTVGVGRAVEHRPGHLRATDVGCHRVRRVRLCPPGQVHERGGEEQGRVTSWCPPRRPSPRPDRSAADLSATNFNIVNGPGAATYPLANFSWTLIYQKQSSTERGHRPRAALRLGHHDGTEAGGRPRLLAAARPTSSAWPTRPCSRLQTSSGATVFTRMRRRPPGADEPGRSRPTPAPPSTMGHWS